jgi:hypothetical protein
VKRKTWLIAVAVVTLISISVGLATFAALASKRADVRLPPNSSFVAICPLEFVDGGLMLAGTCVSGNLTVVEFKAVGDELLVNFTLYDRVGGDIQEGGRVA